MPHRQENKASAVSSQGRPLMHLLSSAAQELAAKAPGRTAVGASGLGRCRCLFILHVGGLHVGG